MIYIYIYISQILDILSKKKNLYVLQVWDIILVKKIVNV